MIDRINRIWLMGLLVTAALPVMADSRIREIAYDAAEVVRLEGCFGFQTTIEFGDAEQIENVGLGDASRWLVVPNKRANMLFVKPSYPSSHSNMTVSTDRRRYSFELVANASESCRPGTLIYNLRFSYPAEPVDAVAPGDMPPVAANVDSAEVVPTPAQRNSAYTFTGTRDNIPQRVFDDGRNTFFRWAEGVATPAVYAVAADKSETLVGFTSRGDYLVVDQVAPSYILRRGNAVAVLYNDAYQMPSLDAASPQPREVAEKPERKRLAWLFHSKEVR